jgi:MraZ protein
VSESAAIPSSTLYSGRVRHAVDRSNRIMLPTDWRGEGAPVHFFLMVHPVDECLVVYPPSAFEALLVELRGRTADKSELGKIERWLNDRVRRCSLDQYGRLPLPPELMAKVGISQQAELVGRFSKFEVWACDKYQAAQSAGEAAAVSALRTLESL